MEAKRVEVEDESRREQDVRYLPCTDWIGYSDRAPDPDHSLRYPHNPTIFPIPEACKESHGQVKGNAEAGVPATKFSYK